MSLISAGGTHKQRFKRARQQDRRRGRRNALVGEALMNEPDDYTPDLCALGKLWRANHVAYE